VNRRGRVAKLIRDTTPISRADVARYFGISPSTAGRIVDDLIQSGIVYEGDQYRAGRMGSPSTELHFNSQIAYVLAVDLRSTTAYGVVTDLDGNILHKASRQLPLNSPERSVADLITLIRELFGAGSNRLPIRALIIGVPSTANRETGVVEWAHSFGWKSLPLGEILQDEFHLPVLIENDVNLAALGEHWKGAARGMRNAVFVSVGTGIGSGIIINGEIYHGSSWAAGEVSYFIADIDTLRDDAGLIGALEKRAARDGVIRRARLVAQRYPASRLAGYVDRPMEEINASDIFSLAMEGDSAARIVFEETVDLLTIVILNISVVLDPEIIILGGPSDWRWDAMVSAIQGRIGTATIRPINLKQSAFDRDSVIMGAAAESIKLEGVLPR
jgi:glucokinase